MIRGKDIVITGIQPWDIKIGSNCKNIAEEMAKTNRVIYVNPPMDIITRYKQREKPEILKRIAIRSNKLPSLEKINENLWTLYPRKLILNINWIPGHSLFELFNKRNSAVFASEINKVLKEMNFTDFILFNDSSMFLGQHLKKHLNPSFYIYYMRDNLILHPYWRRHGLVSEPNLLKKVDLVVNNSELYAEYGRKHNKHSYMVGQGCDLSLFNSEKIHAIPDDIVSIPYPRIGYVGYLSGGRLNIPLLEKIAQEKPQWNIVLVGPEDARFKASKLHQMSNVFFLGSKPPELLPDYIKGFDVAINPQNIKPVTEGNYPRKVDEYLAMGKPIVCSATKTMEYFGDSVYTGKSTEDYIQLIQKALNEDSPIKQQYRRKVAESHSWENNVELIGKYYDMIINEKQHINKNSSAI